MFAVSASLASKTPKPIIPYETAAVRVTAITAFPTSDVAPGTNLFT